MTLVEIARAIGAQTVEEIAAECGFEPSQLAIVEAAVRDVPQPTLVLDFRGGQDASSRWAKYAKGPLPQGKLKHKLDPRTGLKLSPAKRARRK